MLRIAAWMLLTAAVAAPLGWAEPRWRYPPAALHGAEKCACIEELRGLLEQKLPDVKRDGFKLGRLDNFTATLERAGAPPGEIRQVSEWLSRQKGRAHSSPIFELLMRDLQAPDSSTVHVCAVSGACALPEGAQQVYLEDVRFSAVPFSRGVAPAEVASRRRPSSFRPGAHPGRIHAVVLRVLPPVDDARLHFGRGLQYLTGAVHELSHAKVNDLLLSWIDANYRLIESGQSAKVHPLFAKLTREDGKGGIEIDSGLLTLLHEGGAHESALYAAGTILGEGPLLEQYRKEVSDSAYADVVAAGGEWILRQNKVLDSREILPFASRLLRQLRTASEGTQP